VYVSWYETVYCMYSMQSDVCSALFILYAASFCGLMFLVTYLILERFVTLQYYCEKKVSCH